jgi:hypothetical protein
VAKKKGLPKEVLIRWNEDSDEPFLELSESVDDVSISAGESAVVGVYVLNRTALVRCRMDMK